MKMKFEDINSICVDFSKWSKLYCITLRYHYKRKKKLGKNELVLCEDLLKNFGKRMELKRRQHIRHLNESIDRFC